MAAIPVHRVDASGDTFPKNPGEGLVFYHTTRATLFVYDGTADKWFGIMSGNHLSFGFNGSVTNGSSLKLYNGMTTSGTLGWGLPWPSRILAASWAFTSGITSGNMTLREDGVSAGTFAVANANDSVTGLSIDLAANVVISLSNNTGSTIVSPQFQFHAVWVEDPTAA